MADNLSLWKRFADIDPKYTKPITGKAYKGTSPNPQYVIQCLTEMFGPVGQGFGWEVLQDGFEPLGEEVLHWCRVRFWHSDRANCFESYGQTKAYMKTRNGMMLDEDAPKKSLTDAIIKAASHIGIASSIFLGRWDDQKYVQDVAASYREKEGSTANDDTMSKKEARDLYTGLETDMRKITKRQDLIAWWQDPECRDLRMKLPKDWQKNLHDEFAALGKALSQADMMAAG